MKKNLLLCHVGLGDMFICNGLVRTLVDRYGDLTVPAIPDYYDTIKYMYSDDDRIEVLRLPAWDKFVDDLELRRSHFKDVLDLEDYHVTALGFLNEHENVWHGARKIDKGFYAQAKVPFNHKWSRCKWPRAEKQLPVPDGDYIFVHIDKTRQLSFNPTFDLPVVYNTDYYTSNLFEWEDIIRNAKELHVIDSCFSNWIELMEGISLTPKVLYDTKHLFGHPGFPTYLREEWKVITNLKNVPSYSPVEETVWGSGYLEKQVN